MASRTFIAQGHPSYRKFPQKRWMRAHASSSAVVAVA
jgi:hypothetical protein